MTNRMPLDKIVAQMEASGICDYPDDAVQTLYAALTAAAQVQPAPRTVSAAEVRALPAGSVVRFEFTNPLTWAEVFAEWDGESWWATGEADPWYPPDDFDKSKCEATVLYRPAQVTR